MAIEKSWLAVSPRLFTADGGQQGQIKVADTSGFKTKMLVIVQNSAGTQLEAQVKRVNKISIVVGPKPGDPGTQQGKAGLKTYSDISTFTVAGGSFVYAVEQGRNTIKPDDIIQAVYEQEPTVAIRTFPVDQNGDSFTVNNPAPVTGDVQVIDRNNGGTHIRVENDGSINETKINSLIISKYDEVNILSRTADGDIEVVQYKLAGSLQATLTIQYDINGDIANVKRT